MGSSRERKGHGPWAPVGSRRVTDHGLQRREDKGPWAPVGAEGSRAMGSSRSRRVTGHGLQ